MNDNKDYVFHLNWQDREKNSFRVGFLAEIEKEFYFILSKRKTAESAYKIGFVGIPGFKVGEIYKSTELFDFFERRISSKRLEDPCEELAQSGGISMVDSFYLEQVSDTMLPKYKKIILKTYEIQCKKQELENNKQSIENKICFGDSSSR